jgi:L-threonylcarbamoyladenylate synthase
VRLGATQALAGEAVLDFGGQITGGAGPRIDLSASRDLVEAAAALFGALRSLDATGVACIAVAPVPEAGLGAAINDRLRRSAADR